MWFTHTNNCLYKQTYNMNMSVVFVKSKNVCYFTSGTHLCYYLYNAKKKLGQQNMVESNVKKYHVVLTII